MHDKDDSEQPLNSPHSETDQLHLRNRSDARRLVRDLVAAMAGRAVLG